MFHKFGYFTLAIVLAMLSFTPAQADAVKNCSDREGWVLHAWQHFNDKEPAEALSAVDECMEEWIAQARHDQRRFNDGNACPSDGVVPAGERDAIFANGVLNDVGSAQWIRARSAHLLGDVETAREHYVECAEFQCARTWDPKGWFWAPGVNCKARLDSLE